MDDNVWSIIGERMRKGQRSGPIRGRADSVQAVHTGHNNRAGHRLYVKLNQTREFRCSVVGFGRWRNRVAHAAAREYGSHAFNNGRDRGPDRRELRPNMIAAAKASRRAMRQVGWRRP